MAQSLSLSHSPTLSSLHHQPSPFEPTIFKSSESSPYPFSLCSCSLPVILATKRITLRLIHHSYHSSWLRVHMKLFVLFSLPTLYLTTTYYWPFFISFLCIVSVFLLVVSLNLALQRVPSIRWLFGRTLCIKFSSPASGSKPLPRVVWSIGSKPKLMKKPDSGCWVQVYSNGDVYEGEFHKGKCSGSGVFYYHLSGRYEGEWIGGKYDGYGIETWAKGRRYRGQYRQGLRHGVGVYRSSTGDVYAGEWCNGQCHGCGVHTCQDGSTYVGEFKSGVKHGLGYYHFRNGDVYAGEYFADKMHGFGVYRFGNGHQYEGAWHEGRRQGFGLYTFRHGETQSGHWQNGVLNGSTSPKIRNGSSITDDPSKLLHTVQEAKRAAEKAINVATVDERVKRAIAAANKAATAARVTAVKATQNQMHPDNNHSGTHCLSLQA
nr:phosphatidylinositol 4-phosphate 5-kinase 4-like [Ipomoea trifida]